MKKKDNIYIKKDTGNVDLNTKIFNKSLGCTNECNDVTEDLDDLYEANTPKLSFKDKIELKKIISSTDDPAVVATALNSKIQNESTEDVDDDFDESFKYSYWLYR